ncbi:winged helix domain-containing protein [Halocynthiibacter namhaensis]|uniref:winged helix domain-containing protein n=1 Tax=Halocynthiibacter namhaensis TaxID=1290553 RepID=UPI00057916A0|nr:hypothetical protein [Halocynthiibacter namhaensis]
MKIHVTLFLSEQPRTLELKGRLGWAMTRLAKAGVHGISTIEHPAPRLSAYVHSLRKLGVPIETEIEAHAGIYSGHHARYKLSCNAQVTCVEP